MSLWVSKVDVFKLNTPTKSSAWALIHAAEVVVTRLVTSKVLYMGELALFTMYVCTSSVRTYIAKTPKRAIYAVLYLSKVAVDILSTTTFVC